MNRPSVYDFLDYRSFLDEMFRYRKTKGAQFSYRFFANKAGFASPNFLKLVMDGQRNLTNTSIAKVAKGFGLKKKEREFFEYLVFMNQATAHDEKNHYYRKMISIVGNASLQTIAKEQYSYFSKWYYPVIREMVLLEDAAPEKIAAKLKPKITAKQAESAIQLLEKLNLIKRNGNGRWEQVDRDISTGPEIRSMVIANFHKEMLRLAVESIDRFSASQRDISGLTLTIRHENLPELKSRLNAYRKELMELAGHDQDQDMVVQVNFQLFPLTK